MSGRGRRTLCVRFVAFLVALQLALSPIIAAEVDAAKRVGRLTVAFGTVTAEGERARRNLSAASPLFNGDRIIVDNQAAAAMLLDSRVVVHLDGGTVLRILEQRGRTQFQLEQGQVDVYVARRRPELGPVALVDPESEIETTGTIFFASYSPPARLGTYACQENAIKVKTRAGQVVTVPAGKMAHIRGGAFQALEDFDRALIRPQHRTLPQLRERAMMQGERQAQQRLALGSVREAFVAGFAARGHSNQESERLADLLVARCSDLDVDLDNFNGATVRASPGGNLRFYFRDFGVDGEDGDAIQFTARSCTASILTDASDTGSGGPFPLYGARFVSLPVDAPNVVELTIKGVNAGTVRPKIAVQIGFDGFISEPPEAESRRRVKLEEGEIYVYRVLVLPEETPDASLAAAAHESSPAEARQSVAATLAAQARPRANDAQLLSLSAPRKKSTGQPGPDPVAPRPRFEHSPAAVAPRPNHSPAAYAPRPAAPARPAVTRQQR